jgi:acyl dehydratase
LIDQAAIDGFAAIAAAITGDDGPIHTDPVKVVEIVPFGGTIVQGFMMLSHLTGFAKTLHLPDEGVVFRLNYGFDRVRIITPVPVDSRIRGRFTVAELGNRGPNGALMTLRAQVDVEGIDTPAVIADWLAYLQLAELAA